jgi:hypothetical protein
MRPAGHDIRWMRATGFAGLLVALALPAQADTPAVSVLQRAREIFFPAPTEGFALAQPGPARDATSVLNELKHSAPELDPAELVAFAGLLTRPEDLAGALDTEHFRIHYAPGGANRPLDWPEMTFLTDLAAACEDVWRGSHETFPWPQPWSDGSAGGDARTDVYVRDLGWGIYGFSLHEDVGDPVHRSGFIVIDNDFAGMTSLPPQDVARVTLAHEYQHVIQYGFRYAPEADWFMEQTATMMEGQLCPDVHELEGYLPYFTQRPHRRLDLSDGAFEYGAWLWPQYILERQGPDALRAIWGLWSARGGSMLAALEAFFLSRGSSLDAAFLEWATWNAGLGMEGAFGYARRYPRAITPALAITRYPVNALRPAMTLQPEPLGASYVDLRPERGSADNYMELDVTTCGSISEVRLVLWPADATPSVLTIPLTDGRGALVLNSWNTYARAMLVVANGSTSSTCCDYRVDVHTYYRPATVDPLELPVGALRLSAAPNPFGPATVIAFELPQSMPATLRIFDAQGRLVETLAEGIGSSGRHAVHWEAAPAGRGALEAGVFFCEIRTASGSERVRLVRLR